MNNKSKRMLGILAAVMMILPFVMSSCSATEQCEPDVLTSAIEDAGEVSATLYDDGEDTLVLDGGDELAGLLRGDWKKTTRGSGKKVVSITVSMQYEVCFFDDGSAMIYYGYCGVFQKDRQYFEVDLDNGLSSLLEYVKENGAAAEDTTEK